MLTTILLQVLLPGVLSSRTPRMYDMYYNTANNNTNAGIYLYDSDNINITGNSANQSIGSTRQQYGILLQVLSNNNTLSNNSVSNNFIHGMIRLLYQ